MKASRFNIAAICIAASIIGCSQPTGPVFPPLENPPVFPHAPDPARIRYVGSLASSADLKAGQSGFQAIGSAIFGKHPPTEMLSPYALCTDGKDRVFVADSNAQVVHVFDLKTRKYASWTPAKKKKFAQPVGIAPDAMGGIFVADSIANAIYHFNAEGGLIAELPNELLSRPCGIAYDTKNERLFVADSELHQVLILSPEGKLLARIGSRGTEHGKFNYPTNLALDSQGRLYVSDSLNFRIQQFGPNFAFIRQIGKKGDLPGYFSQPKGIAVDREDHLYVVDANFEAVQIFDTNGQLLLDFGQEGRAAAEFWLPAGIFIDANNRIWIADTYNRRVQVFDYLPEVKP
jgi:DNA-binding beta-propeller fold protein YncE